MDIRSQNEFQCKTVEKEIIPDNKDILVEHV